MKTPNVAKWLPAAFVPMIGYDGVLPIPMLEKYKGTSRDRRLRALRSRLRPMWLPRSISGARSALAAPFLDRRWALSVRGSVGWTLSLRRAQRPAAGSGKGSTRCLTPRPAD